MTDTKLIHCLEVHPETNAYNATRKKKAQASWEVLYKAGVVPAHYEKYARDSRGLGDPRGLPYFKDTIAHGLALADSEDSIIFWTNDDDWLHPALPGMLRTFLAIYQACTAQRREFQNKPFPVEAMTPEQITMMSEVHMGRDLIAATKAWWLKHWSEIPDFLLGAESFDICLASLIRKNRGFKTTHANLYERIQCCELPFGYVSHEAHTSAWPMHTLANNYNRELFKQWALKYAPHIQVPI